MIFSLKFSIEDKDKGGNKKLLKDVGKMLNPFQMFGGLGGLNSGLNPRKKKREERFLFDFVKDLRDF